MLVAEDMQINDAAGMSWLVKTMAAFWLRSSPHHLTAHTEPLQQVHEHDDYHLHSGLCVTTVLHNILQASTLDVCSGQSSRDWLLTMTVMDPTLLLAGEALCCLNISSFLLKSTESCFLMLAA